VTRAGCHDVATGMLSLFASILASKDKVCPAGGGDVDVVALGGWLTRARYVQVQVPQTIRELRRQLLRDLRRDSTVVKALLKTLSKVCAPVPSPVQRAFVSLLCVRGGRHGLDALHMGGMHANAGKRRLEASVQGTP